ncbi:MAG: hypothetical protein NVV68_08810 [Dokdonella sp.]|nr:hypothetical protein [Dokdonella sp.]
MNKRLEYIFGISSLTGLVITVCITLYALLSGNYAPEAGAMLIGLGAINVVLGVVVIGTLLRAEEYWQKLAELGPQGQLKDEKIRALSDEITRARESGFEVARIIHNINDQLRDRINELFALAEDINGGASPSPEELVDIRRTNEMFYLFLVDNIKILMDIITGDKCAVTMKIVDASNANVLMMRTFMRDAASYCARRGSDSSAAEYPYYENTAFKEILAGARCNYFVSDNLSSEPTYSNSNPNWKRLYNATLVCPIRMQLNLDEVTDRQEFSVLGFLCVDNFKGGLNRPDCIELLASIADSLFNHLLILHYVAPGVDEAEGP